MSKPGRAQVSVVVGAIVGVLLALPADGALATALHLFGYPVALIVIVRWVLVVRERRLAWFMVHELAMACICLGFLTMDEIAPVVPNALWLVVAAFWYLRRSSPTRG